MNARPRDKAPADPGPTRRRSAKEVETWQLSPDGNRLTIRLRLGGGRMPEITLTRVYDRGEADAPPDGR